MLKNEYKQQKQKTHVSPISKSASLYFPSIKLVTQKNYKYLKIQCS